jgi:hypothetical protein
VGGILSSEEKDECGWDDTIFRRLLLGCFSRADGMARHRLGGVARGILSEFCFATQVKDNELTPYLALKLEGLNSHTIHASVPSFCTIALFALILTGTQLLGFLIAFLRVSPS